MTRGTLSVLVAGTLLLSGIACTIQNTEKASSAMTIETDLEQLRAAARTNDIAIVEAKLREIDQKWSDSNEQYIYLLRVACDEIHSQHFNDKRRARSVLRTRAMMVLEQADRAQIDVQMHVLVSHLKFDEQDLTELGDDWPVHRQSSAGLWLKTWSALEDLIDPTWKLNDPTLEVAPYQPPPGVHAPPSGAPPEAIKDPGIRADYSAHLEKNKQLSLKNKKQVMLRKLITEYQPEIESYLIRLYSDAADNHSPLQQLVDIVKDQEMKRRILLGVQEQRK